MVPADPELLAVGVVLHGEIAFPRIGVAGSARDKGIACAVHDDGTGGVVTVSASVIASFPKETALRRIFQEEAIITVRASMGDIRLAGHKNVAGSVQGQAAGRLAALSILGDPNLISVSVVFYGGNALNPALLERCPSDINLSSAVHRQALDWERRILVRVIVCRPKLNAIRIVLHCDKVEPSAGI